MRFDKRKSKRSKSGYTWRVTIDYYDQYGRKSRHSKSGFATKKQAEAYGRQILDTLDSGISLEQSGKTLDEVYGEWLSLSTLRESTMQIYSNCYKKHVSPVLGSQELKKIGYPQLQAFFNGLDIGKAGACNIKKVLKSIGQLAVKSGYVQSFPIDLVEIRQERRRIDHEQYLSRTDMNRLLDQILSDHGDAYKAGLRCMVILLGYYAGLRIAEICALRFEDFSDDFGTLSVKRQLIYNSLPKSAFKESETLKTDSSQDSLPVAKPLREALRKWREYSPYSLICCMKDGTYVIPSDIRRSIDLSARKIGLHFHPHMLRHSFITNLIMSGADPKTAAKLARHADPSITLAIYTEVTEQRKQEIIDTAFPAFDDAPDLKA